MSEVDLREGVAALDATVSRLTQAVTAQADRSAQLADNVRENNALTAQNRTILNRIGKLMLFKLLTLIIMGVALFKIIGLSNTINDCLSPEGQCAQRNAAATVQILAAAGTDSEIRRLTSEIRIAQARDDTFMATERTKLRDEYITTQQHIVANIVAIRKRERLPFPDAARNLPIPAIPETSTTTATTAK